MTDGKNEKCDLEKSEEVTRGEALKTTKDEAEEIKKEARETVSQDEVTGEANCQAEDGGDFADRVDEDTYPTDEQSESDLTDLENHLDVQNENDLADLENSPDVQDESDLAKHENSFDGQEENDLAQLRNSLPELKDLAAVSNLKYPEEYARFRALGLTPREAYLATGERREPIEARRITSPMSVKRTRDAIPEYYLKMAREIFGGLSDREIQSLYSRVNRRQ